MKKVLSIAQIQWHVENDEENDTEKKNFIPKIS